MLHNAQVVGFAEGTPILMADGKWKPIEKVQQGDWVMSFNPDTENSELEPRQVTDTYATLHRDCIEIHTNGKVTVVAKDQLFFTPGAGWLPGADTKQVINFSGDRQDIQVRRVRGGKFKVYDITVDKTHALVANDLRVHNKKKKKIQAPQPVVTAGKPGKPVSVTTTYNGNTTTVVVNPSPGSSAQVSVASNGTIAASQNSSPGLPISDGTDYQPYRVMPYPGGSYVRDRARNAEIIRSSICGAILNKAKNYKLTKADETAWETELDNLVTELQSIKTTQVSTLPGNRSSMIYKDPTIINDAIKSVNQIKKELKAGKKITQGIIRQNCDKLASMIDKISNSVGFVPGGRPYNDPCAPVWSEDRRMWINSPCQHIAIPTTPPTIAVCPAPESYQTERIYDSNANFAYMIPVDNGTCQFVYDPPDAPAVITVRYYKHYDPAAGKFYYDRVSGGAVCS